MAAMSSGPGRGRLGVALVAVALAVAGLAVPSSAAARWPSWPGAAGGVFRSGAYARGGWIYTNGIDQALGANADGLHRSDYYRPVDAPPGVDQGYKRRDVYLALTYDFFGAHRAAHNGDYQLPTDARRWPYGTADLAEVRLATDARYLYVRWRWNSFPRRDAQIATLTFAAAGARPAQRAWPRNARVGSRWQAALTVWGDGGALARPGRRETGVVVRSGDHVTEARVPLAELPRGPWSLTGGAGLDDPAAPGRYWTVPPGDAGREHPGSGAPSSPTNTWDLLFARDRPWTFDERRQADDLARGDAGPDTATVSPAALARHRSRAGAQRTGDLSRMFTSRLFEGDGIRTEKGVSPVEPPAGATPPIPNPGFDVSYLYTGRLQWYGMHVPGRYARSRRRWPLIVYLHGFTGLPDEAFHNPVGLVRTADRRGYLVATPLGRGDYYYRGEGDLDVLEVVRDVERHYRVDPSRIYLMGHSMGGYGTNNVATHHPDLFAAVAPAEGTDSIDLHANLRDVPWFEISAQEDLDAGARDARQLYADLSADGYDARLLVYGLKTHEYSSIYDTLPQLFAFFAAHRRALDPGVVSWTRPVGQDRPGLGLVYDGAYWLDGVRAADRHRPATVTVASDRIAHATPEPNRATRTQRAIDTHGPSGRSTGTLYQTTPNRRPRARRSNTLHLEAVNTRALTIDAARAHLELTRARPLTIRSHTDRVARLALSRLGARRATVTVDGRRARNLRARGRILAVTIPRGRHVIVLSALKPPRRRPPPPRFAG